MEARYDIILYINDRNSLEAKKAVSATLTPMPLHPNPQSNLAQAQEDKNAPARLPLGLLGKGMGWPIISFVFCFLECGITGLIALTEYYRLKKIFCL